MRSSTVLSVGILSLGQSPAHNNCSFLLLSEVNFTFSLKLNKLNLLLLTHTRIYLYLSNKPVESLIMWRFHLFLIMCLNF